ncbi:thioredoxin [Candidatus Uhrbacteria bacterium]|nr:thioredoxin [Candidatus Uhrbacteria bacterium]
MLQLTDQTFEAEVLKAPKMVMVDFWAPWCGPCHIMAPILAAIEKEYEGKPVKITKLNVDENREIPGSFGIMSIPTLLFFKGGKVVEQIVGTAPKEVLRGKIEKHL